MKFNKTTAFYTPPFPQSVIHWRNGGKPPYKLYTMRILIFLFLSILSDAKSQSIEVGVPQYDPNQKTFWLDGETYNTTYPSPEYTEIHWHFSGKDGSNFLIVAEPDDTVQVDVAGEYVVRTKAVWMPLETQTHIPPNICVVLPESVIDEEPEIQQKTWSSGGKIYATGNSCYIITMDGFMPVEIVEANEYQITQPATHFYVVWQSPYYKNSGLYKINHD